MTERAKGRYLAPFGGSVGQVVALNQNSEPTNPW